MAVYRGLVGRQARRYNPGLRTPTTISSFVSRPSIPEQNTGANEVAQATVTNPVATAEDATGSLRDYNNPLGSDGLPSATESLSPGEPGVAEDFAKDYLGNVAGRTGKTALSTGLVGGLMGLSIPEALSFGAKSAIRSIPQAALLSLLPTAYKAIKFALNPPKMSVVSQGWVDENQGTPGDTSGIDQAAAELSDAQSNDSVMGDTIGMSTDATGIENLGQSKDLSGMFGEWASSIGSENESASGSGGMTGYGGFGGLGIGNPGSYGGGAGASGGSDAGGGFDSGGSGTESAADNESQGDGPGW